MVSERSEQLWRCWLQNVDRPCGKDAGNRPCHFFRAWRCLQMELYIPNMVIIWELYYIMPRVDGGFRSRGESVCGGRCCRAKLCPPALGL